MQRRRRSSQRMPSKQTATAIWKQWSIPHGLGAVDQAQCHRPTTETQSQATASHATWRTRGAVAHRRWNQRVQPKAAPKNASLVRTYTWLCQHTTLAATTQTIATGRKTGSSETSPTCWNTCPVIIPSQAKCTSRTQADKPCGKQKSSQHKFMPRQVKDI